MPRYKYHEDWRVSAQWDCHFWVSCRSLADALWIAALKNDNSHISVHADCEQAGIKAVVSVGLTERQIRGRPIEEILELFDKEVDEFIACRLKTGQWGNSDGAA